MTDALCPDHPEEQECDCLDGPYTCSYSTVEGLCVEKNGQCARGADCRCKNQETTEGGW